MILQVNKPYIAERVVELPRYVLLCSCVAMNKGPEVNDGNR
jgi:hypothetical protein